MTDEEIKALTVEQTQLSKLQQTSILKAAYSRMTKEEVEVYDQRYARIVEVRRLLSEPKPA